MPPVEIESIPAVPEVEVASTLKTLDKAMELPIINDAVNMATKLHQQATQFPSYNQVEAIVTNGVEMVNAGLSEGVKSSVHTAVSSLDSLASTGLDKLTTSVPALATPTEEILPTITGTISASAATDYVASFGLVQSGLKLADTALSLGEKAVTSLAPSVEETTLAGGMIKQVRVVRRALRAVRHAGRRAGDEGSGGVTGWIMDLLHINAILGFFGLSLNKPSSEDGPIATSGEESDVDETNDDETLAEKLEKDYGNESQDPDYVPSHPTEDSLEYKSDEEALEASQDISQDPAAEEPEASQDESQEALEAKSDEEALEASQDESQDPASEEPEASQDESQETEEQPAEALEASQDVSQEPASEELEASREESLEAKEQPAAVIEAEEVAIEASQEQPETVIEAAEVATEACHGESLENLEDSQEDKSDEEALEVSQDKSEDPASEELEASKDKSEEAKEQPAAVIEAEEVAGESLENLEDSQDKSDEEALEASQDKSEEAKEQPAAVIEAAEVATEACHRESLENEEDSELD